MIDRRTALAGVAGMFGAALYAPIARAAGLAQQPAAGIPPISEGPPSAPVFTPDSKLAKEFEELTPRDGEKVIGKNHPSSFADTDLQEYLGSEAGTKVVLTGYMVSSERG